LSSTAERRIDPRYIYTEWKEGMLYEVDGQHRSLRFYKVDMSPHGLGGHFVGRLPEKLYSDFFIFKKGFGMLHYKLTWYVEESIDSFRFGMKLLDNCFPSCRNFFKPESFQKFRLLKKRRKIEDVKLVF
jgi:hypothetical protein